MSDRVIPGRSEAEGKGIQERRRAWVRIPFPALRAAGDDIGALAAGGGAGYAARHSRATKAMSSKPTNKLKARLPRGFADRGAADLAATNRMLEAIRETYELYGFEAVETPFVEYTDALGKFLPDQDRPNEGVFSFQDDDEQWLSLRYDLTAPLARYVAENFDALPKPYRSYRAGWVFRNEKPGPGRFRQFMQFDADTVGSASVAADAEMCMMAADTLERLGLNGQYLIKLNNRKVLDAVLEAIGLGGEDKAHQRLTVLRAIDKFDRLGDAGVRALLGEGRKDESGDFTKGAGLPQDDIEYVLDIFSPDRLMKDAWTWAEDDPIRAKLDMTSGKISGRPAFWDNLKTLDLMRLQLRRRNARTDGIDELEAVIRNCEAGGYGSSRIVVDAIVRGLEYYTGPVYEAELTFEVLNDDGQPVRFGSVGGGGRYDGLIGRFRPEPVPATGFSIGVSRLLAALQAVKSPVVSGADRRGPVVVLVMDRDRIADYQRMVAKLRGGGIAAEMYLGAAGMKAQMKYADRRKSPCVVIQGSDERAKGEVQIKDLVLGAALAGGGKDRADYLNRQAESQFSTSEANIVEAVRRVLARHSTVVKNG
jgi:histidyl-tRNA synthetase